MSVIIEKRLADDLGGAGEATAVRFTIDGVEREIHLNKRNRETFLRRMGVYIDASHSVPTGRRRTMKDNARIRTWAREQGYTVPDRGRIPQKIVD